MKTISTQLTFAFMMCISYNMFAQFEFTNSNHLLSDNDFHSGVAVAVADANGDGLDDIIRFNEGNDTHIEYQTVSGRFFTKELGAISNGSAWSTVVADLNNDGHGDILGGKYSGVTLMTSNGIGEYETNFLEGFFFAQNANYFDINNDGYLDIFVCDDDAESNIFTSNGDGNFFPADEWIDMRTVPESDNSGNYGSIWCDFDNDGDTDLYIAKCRQSVNDPEDPRRVNALYENDGQNNFTETAGDYGLKIGWQSWTASFEDIDNDGDFDCFITNHDAPSQLLENDGTGHFTEITEESGINYEGLAIQGVMRDFDNDGFVDLIISGTSASIYKNNGDKTFTEIMDVFDEEDIESYGIGDLNNDGFLDIYASYAEIFTNPTDIDDVLWLNEGNENNYISIGLEGIESNRDGIGSRIEIYGEWGKQIREVRAGESYGISNSLCAHFGLGASTSIDSVIVKWPSGTIDKLENPTVNQLIQVIEGTCTSTFVTTFEEDKFICEGQNITVGAISGDSYLWSNGATTQGISITEPGVYSVTTFFDDGCSMRSNSFAVYLSGSELFTIGDGDIVACEGELVTLDGPEGASSYQWSSGEITQNIDITSSGSYSLTITDAGGCETSSEAIEVTILDVTPLTIQSVDFDEKIGSIAIIEATGDSILWFDKELATEPIATGSIFETPPVLEFQVTYWVESQLNYEDEPFCISERIAVVLDVTSSTEMIQGIESMDLYPNPASDLVIISLTTNESFDCEIQVINALGQFVSKPIQKSLTIGEQNIELTISTLPAGTYQIQMSSSNGVITKALIKK